MVSEDPNQIREEILDLVRRYSRAAHGRAPFAPEHPEVPISGRVFDEEEVVAFVDAGLDFWLTAGPVAQAFEEELAKEAGVRFALMTNSGSSANLLAVATLCSRRMGEEQLRRGDEVVTNAVGFPTTVAPLVQHGLVPVYVDPELGTYNPTVESVEAALSPKTRAVMMAHTLGNPFDAAGVAALAEDRGLLLVEDCCDALGGTLGGRKVGTFGDLATLSFYPAHQITTGEGGAVLTGSSKLNKFAEGVRDWGRDCWCAPGEQNTCKKRFGWKLGDLPVGYDHKYTYSDLGYNIKGVEVQAAVGLSQLHKLPGFVQARRRNFATFYEGLADLEEFLILPRALEGAEPSWFGFPLTLREASPVKRDALVRALEEKGIATRPLFGGNLMRQPGFSDVEHRISGTLENADTVLASSFWVGTYPGIDAAMADYVVETIRGFLDTD